MPKLPVKGLQRQEWRQTIVRLNRSHRAGLERNGVAKITNTAARTKSCLVVLLGHDDEEHILWDLTREKRWELIRERL